MVDTLKIRQASFAGGEISPDLHGRTDLDTYAKSLKSCKNFIVTPYGTLRNRPGFKFLGHTKNNKQARLIPFRYDKDNNFILEFTPAAFRVWKDGELQVVDGGSGTFLPTGWWSSVVKIQNLDFTQMGRGMVITEISENSFEEPYFLEWDGGTAWTFWEYDAKVANAHPAAGVTALVWHTIANLSKNSSEGPLLEWTWKVSWVNAEGVESDPSAALIVDVSPNHMCVMSPDVTMPAGVITSGGALMQWTGTANGNGYKIYRGVNGTYGLVGFLLTSAGGTVLFQDDGREPDYTQQPVTNAVPYGTAGPAHSPDCVAYMDQRLIFGQQGTPGTDALARVAGSWLGRPFDWHEQSILSDDGPFTFSIAGAFREQIRHLVPLRDLIVLTGSAEYILSGAQRGIIGPLSVRARPESQHGASWLKPLVINNSCIYVQDRGGIIRDLFYDFQRDGYNGTDLSVRARHLLLGVDLYSWAFAENADSVLWMTGLRTLEAPGDANSGLRLLGMTYSPDGRILAWHHHEILTKFYPGFQGIYSIAVAPEDENDTVYICRMHLLYDAGGEEWIHGGDTVTPTFYIEAMAPRNVKEPRFGVFLDSYGTYDGRNRANWFDAEDLGTPASDRITLFVTEDEGWNVGDTNAVGSSGAVFTPVDDVGRYIVLNPDSVGDEPLVVMLIKTVTSTTEVTAEIISMSNGSTVLPVHYRTGVHPEWAFGDHTFTGLDHLEAEDVYALVDGVVSGPYTVAAGAITLTGTPVMGVVVHVGLRIDAEVETLDAWIPEEPGFKSMVKDLAQVYVEVDTSDGLQAATAVGTFKALPEGTDQVEGDTVARYDHNGRVKIKQNSPLPVSIRAIVREFMVED